MLIKAFFLAALIAVSGVPAMAESTSARFDLNQTGAMHSTPERSGDARRKPTANQLNRAYGNHYRMRSNARAQYRQDQRVYMAEVRRSRHNRAVNRYDRRFARQQTAYAKAMAAWRLQVKACKRGDNRACKRPSPRTADFY
ncbi:hypothetical protein NHF48_001230 [Sphingomonas sp. H160509]|uniref:hypothetical protein n=1 Tax=Sphingomonas sp. H160509 TaxID=2955313 RepID=UPI00209817B4|nr:hypothetical protein [Sphingomonas sp. H160509]MDD1449871.1 hypothetical protein [Sphingomonas sp. H160509]